MMDALRGLVRIGSLGCAIAAAGACSGGRAGAPPPQSAQGQSPAPAMQPMTGEQGMASMCPMHAPGASVTAQDTQGGAALVFTTTGDVEDLRTRVRQMADMHNRMGPHTMGGQMQGGGMHEGHGMMGMMMVESEATVADIEGGARLELRPRDPAQLDQLRASVRTHAQQLAAGECPMMEQGPSAEQAG